MLQCELRTDYITSLWHHHHSSLHTQWAASVVVSFPEHWQPGPVIWEQDWIKLYLWHPLVRYSLYIRTVCGINYHTLQIFSLQSPSVLLQGTSPAPVISLHPGGPIIGTYHIVGSLSREKTFGNWWKIWFSWRKLLLMAHFCCAKECFIPKFRGKTYYFLHSYSNYNSYCKQRTFHAYKIS